VSRFEVEEFRSRLEALQLHLTKKGITWGILTGNADLYYYTGSMQPSYLLIPALGEAILVARKAIDRIELEASHLSVATFGSGKEFLAILDKLGMPHAESVGLTFDVISHASALRLQKSLSQVRLEDISSLVRSLRMVKSPAELKIQREAAHILSQGPVLALKHFQPGMSELELSLILENFFRRNGHCMILRCRREGVEMAGYGICSSGVNSLVGTKFEGICSGMGISAASPHGAALTPVGEHVPVILDYAFNLEGYHVDQTRMFCWGEPSAEFKEAYDAMVRIEETIAREIEPGLAWGFVYEHAARLAAEAGYAESFMGAGQEKVRFVGHGVGVELDELPYLAEGMDAPLQAGMVIALEPKVALPGVGIVGIEDTYLIGHSGVEQLTDCPKDILVYKPHR
jgi:Xaa-Pro dipeptidase